MGRMTKRKRHPYIPELKEQLRKGEIDRREFLRTATLLGVSAASAYAMAGAVGRGRAFAATPKTSGTLRVGMNVMEITDPAKFDWTEEGQRRPPHHRVLRSRRQRQHFAAVPGRGLGDVKGSKDLDLQSAQGRQMVERR